jgi:hypothetical protein
MFALSDPLAITLRVLVPPGDNKTTTAAATKPPTAADRSVVAVWRGIDGALERCDDHRQAD